MRQTFKAIDRGSSESEIKTEKRH